MARTNLSVQQIVRTGLTHTFAAVDQPNGNEFVNDGACFLYVKNASGGSINVTTITQPTVDSLAVADLVVAVGAGVNKLIGPFPPSIYNTDGKVQVDFSAGTSVTAAVIRL
jgi:hypothetical protein